MWQSSSAWARLYLTDLLHEAEPSWEANTCSSIQEIPSLLWNQKVYYRVLKSQVTNQNYIHKEIEISLNSRIFSTIIS
jgi:hypothetical protein